MRVIFFITHTTLTYQHANMTFKSLANSKDPVEFDELIIYNTHQYELSNDELIKLYKSYDIPFIKNLYVFDYDENTPKTLGGDVKAIRDFCLNKYSQTDHILLLKSDILLSINLLNEINKFPIESDNFVFTPIFITAKKSVTDEELTDYIKLPYAVLSSEDTFYMEDEIRSVDNDFRNRMGVTPKDKKIKYMSCRVKRDWSCHYLPVKALMMLELKNQTWGGISLEPVSDLWIGSYKSFTVHRYHGIGSINNASERPGEWGEWLAS
jgi:hypothetical protein